MRRAAESANPTAGSALLVFGTSAAAGPADSQTLFFACWQEEISVEHKEDTHRRADDEICGPAGQFIIGRRAV